MEQTNNSQSDSKEPGTTDNQPPDSDTKPAKGETKKDIQEKEKSINFDLLQNISKTKPNWYVINTYSGYEDHVKQALLQRIDSMDMSEKIFDVVVPKEKKVEIKNGKKKVVEKKIFPGYVLVHMLLNEDSWYVVRNTPSVTGFIGFGSKPTPLSDEEIKNIQKRMGLQEPEYKIDFEIGDSVKIIDGPFKDFDGIISEIDKVRGKIKVLVSMFGRETP
ncbi:transcription termination/antitermination protein NusG, partial [Patescibacteria group bacterium]|nr:transcription termination/antitermination protein NusG [Patescibacteria group bacterium]